MLLSVSETICWLYNLSASSDRFLLLLLFCVWVFFFSQKKKTIVNIMTKTFIHKTISRLSHGIQNDLYLYRKFKCISMVSFNLLRRKGVFAYEMQHVRWKGDFGAELFFKK